MPSSLSDVDGLVLSRILLSLSTIADLASLARCSKRLCEEVQGSGASDAWQKHADTLPECPSEKRKQGEQAAAKTTPPTTPTPTTPTPSWHPPPPCAAARLCRARLEHWRRVSFAHLRVERMQRDSELDQAERAVRAWTQEAAAEERTRERLAREAAAILDALRMAGGAAASSSRVQAWVPAAVQAGWDAAGAAWGGGGGVGGFAPSPSVVVAAQGIDAHVRLRQLEQELTLSDMRAENLAMSLAGARRKLELERVKIRGLETDGRWGPGGGGSDEKGGRVRPEPLVLY
jgi:hypothetical protein